MDFQSAARFGERRVMVTDYDETAVKVNAKVVNEDTGEVICESGGSGGKTNVSVVTLTIVNEGNGAAIINNLIHTDEIGLTSDAIASPPNSTANYNIILYEGNSTYFTIATADNIRYGDNIKHSKEEGDYVLTGDDTITLVGTGQGA